MLKLETEERLFKWVVWGLTAIFVFAIIVFWASLIAAISCWSVTSLGTPRFACSMDLIEFAIIGLIVIATATWGFNDYSFARSVPIVVIIALVFLVTIWIEVAIRTGAIIGYLSW